MFYLELGGFDTHSSAQQRVQEKLEQVNAGLTAFVDELKLQGVWNQVAVLTLSDFGRTLDSNGAGTDHAWGGNYVLFGGGVRGSTIHGSYPTSLLPVSDVHIGRGRLLPTTSWEAVWNGIAEWFDVPTDRLADVLPNRANFASDSLLRKRHLFDVVR